jgi:hypothetical protein
LSEEENKLKSKEPEKAEKKSRGWIRPVSYGFLLAALFFTVTYDRISDGSGSWRTVLQILALGCLVVGAALFFSVKEKRQ